ncbi:MAG: MBL fold metallo-hydrolase RNA specificity domain-containing protein, partial [Desulfobulbaceae bacterium]|nr:MBL fold metallo-hydrolase RNA specificity domain-containing protein [Desulfobulbaceae bacterium]
YELDRLFAKPSFQKFLTSAGLQNLPVVVDSPLGVKLTTVYAEQKAYWDQEAHDLLNRGDNPIDFKQLYSSVKFQSHQQLVEMQGPAIIIAGSGMCTGGRILDHLVASLNDSKTDIFFVGYQAKGTLGRRITEQSERNGTITIDGHKIRMQATVHTLSGYSAHADQQGLIDWVASMPQKPGTIKLIHGEAAARNTLGEKLRERGYNVIDD